MQPNATPAKFTRQEMFVIAMLAFLQFTVILDFMVLSPLGAVLLKELNITTKQFGLVISAYAFSAGASGFLTAGFADKFDRKRLLLFFYTGFIIGTLLCGIAPTYSFLLMARIVTGLFGGVLSSISFAIITDLFAMQVRGRVMGFVQMAFAASQVLGIPFGLFLANHFGWHSPFLLIVGLGCVVGIIIMLYLQPIDAHLKLKSERNAFQHLLKTVTHNTYLQGFLATTLLATGGFMLMPFGSAFSTHNLGISLDDLPLIYLVTGLCSIVMGPALGRVSDTIGKFKLFTYSSLAGIVLVIVFTQLGITPLWAVIALNVVLFATITGRMVSSSALVSALPDPQDRGAFMSINSSVQQVSGGVASAVAGLIVIQSPTGFLERYDLLGYIVAGTMFITIFMLRHLNNLVDRKLANQKAVQPTPADTEQVSTH